MPAAASGPELSAPDLYTRLRDSVFLIMAGESYEQIVQRKGTRTVGSAVAIEKHTLLTNCHVINGFSAILAYGRSGFFRVTKQRGDERTDRCVLTVEDGRDVVPVPGVRTASDVKVGERVYSVGSPEGLESTLGEGIISGLHDVEGMTVLQTTAQISRGSSGGGLFDTRGNLVGITTLKHVRGEALNFAIPADAFFRK